MAAVAALLLVAAYTLVVVPIRALSHARVPTAAMTPSRDAVNAPPAIVNIEKEAPAPPAPMLRAPRWRVANLAGDPTLEIVETAIGRRPMIAALAANGVSRVDVSRLFKAFEGVHNFDRIHPKDSILVAKRKTTGHLVAFELQGAIPESASPARPWKPEVWQARENDLGVLEAKSLDLSSELKRVTFGLPVGGELRDSMAKALEDGPGLRGSPSQVDDMLKMLDDALDGHAELSDLHSGARLRIVADEERVEGAFARYTELSAVEYTPENSRLSPIRVYFFARPPPHGAYYDGRGRQPFHGGWRSPLPFGRISSRYNPRRMHPVLHVVMPHNGVDFSAPPGTPVYATAAGVVKIAGDGGPCGNMVQVAHSNGLVSAYCHLSRFASGLHAGQHVESRQLVGYVGQTGRATGPHLHFAIKRGESFIDPLSLKLDGVRVLPPSDRDVFEKTRVQLDAALDAIPLPAAAAEGAPLPLADAGVDDTIFDELGADGGP